MCCYILQKCDFKPYFDIQKCDKSFDNVYKNVYNEKISRNYAKKKNR